MPNRKLSKLNDHSGHTGVIYARYSSALQKDESIEQQVEAAKAYAKDLGIVITHIYADRAISGKTDKRPEFQKMLRDAEKGRFGCIIAWKSNRIGRNMLQAMVNEERFSEMGVKCLYVEEDFEDNAAGRFALRSMMNVNQFYIENMAEDIMRALRDLAKDGKIVGSIPYGYKKGDDHRFAIDDKKAEIVREIFTRVAEGELFIDIARDLNARGVPAHRGKEWKKNSCQRLLQNRKYIGEYKYMDIVIPGAMPRIISDDLFYRVQEVCDTKQNPMNNRRRNSNGTYALTGKLYCGKCGAPMTGMSGHGRNGLHFYYICQSRRRSRTCDMRNVVREEIERKVADAVMRYALTDEVIEWIADQAVAYAATAERESGLSFLLEEKAVIERSIANLMNAIEQGIITETTKARLTELEDQKAAVRSKIANAKACLISVSREQVIAAMRVFRDGDIDDPAFRIKLFDTFLKAVYVYDDELKIVFSFAGEKNTVNLKIDKDSIDDIGESEENSDGSESTDRFVLAPVWGTHTGLNEPRLYCRGITFVLVVPVEIAS